MCFYFVRVFQLAGLVAASTAAEASNEALQAMLAQDHGAEGGVLDAWLTLSAHKVCCIGSSGGCLPVHPVSEQYFVDDKPPSSQRVAKFKCVGGTR